MKKLIYVLSMFGLFACSNVTPMTNDNIIAEHKKCEEAGLFSESITVDGRIVAVQCALKEVEKPKPPKKEVSTNELAILVCIHKGGIPQINQSYGNITDCTFK